MSELTEFELRLFEWIRQSDFESVAWSTKKAAKSFKCTEDEIYEGVASLTKKVPIIDIIIPAPAIKRGKITAFISLP